MPEQRDAASRTARPVGSGRPGSVLIVCTANRYRSPLAEAELRAALSRLGRDDIGVRSAGTDAVPSAPIADAVLRQLEREGIHPNRTSSRLLTRELVEGADLILTAERAHRSKVVRLSPAAHRKTFTLLQASRLVAPARPLPHETGAAVARLAARLAAARGVEPQSEADDIPDPAGRSGAVYEKANSLIRGAVDTLAAALSEM